MQSYALIAPRKQLALLVRFRKPLSLVVIGSLGGVHAYANPEGMSIGRGTVSSVQTGLKLDITASHNAVIDWKKFNINPGETTTFYQPSPVSIVWNRIFDQDPSKIWGNLNGNGYVVLMNQNGFYFGPGSVVHVNGLVVTTVPVAPESSGGGGMWQFTGMPPLAKIENYGEIKAQNGGSLFLISEKVENHGILSAPEGTIGLYAGKEVLLSSRPDGRGLSASVRLPVGTVDNSGKIIADAGTVAMHAAVVNQRGLVQANSVRERNGVIELVASDTLNLDATSQISATGGADGVSDAGKITLKSEQAYTDKLGSRVDVSGGTQGGKGGAVEISAPRMSSLQSSFDGSAQAGFSRGQVAIDPTDIILSSSAGSSTVGASGTAGAGDAPFTLKLNVISAFASFAQITLQATRDISLEPNTVWNLNSSTGVGDSGSLLTLEAGRNILFGSGARITSSGGWSVRLSAGTDFTVPLLAGDPAGSIYLNGGKGLNGDGTIETSDGSISLFAKNEIQLGSGAVRTSAGGSINVTAVSGDVDAGTSLDSLQYAPRTGTTIGRNPDGSLKLGGIATAFGGDVNIQAGRDILSFTPMSGAYGGGNVQLTSGRDLKGRFYIKNGVGTIQAGNNVGSDSSPVTLGLVKGSWNVAQAIDIKLREVFNPNGTLNANKIGGIPFRFDYDAQAAVTLNATHGVELLGAGLERRPDNTDMVPVYPPNLKIRAGAGGVTLGNDVVLYPAPSGQLDIKTTDGGSLRSKDGVFYQMIMSDSALKTYADKSLPPSNLSDLTLADGHASTPVHINDMVPAKIDVSGSIENLFIRIPKQADISVAGDARNFSYDGQHLHPGDVTHLNIAGDFLNRSDRTVVTLADGGSFDSIFNPAFPLRTAYPDLAAKLTWDPLTHKLGFSGVMQAYERDILLHPMVYAVDQFGNLKRDADGNPILYPATLTADAAALQSLYQMSLDIPNSPLAKNGIQIGGPGALQMAARDLDLGITQGIRSIGPQRNDALGPISSRGADISIELTRDLRITSSQIASFNGGNIGIKAQGRLDVGSQERFSSADTPKGIYTGNGGNVTVEAKGDILLKGSRIATYNGGDISVVSHEGNIDAGTGARGFFGVPSREYDSATGQFADTTERFFGSGIVALTRPGGSALVGNISVKTDKGDILASSGGILQLAFNNVDQSGAKVALDSGGDIRANQSGILGGSVSLAAKGSIDGIIVARLDIKVDSGKDFTGTAIGGGAVSVSAGGSVSGTVVGGGNVSVSGADVGGALVVGSGSVSADSGAKVGAFSNVSAPATQQTTQDATKTVAAKPAEDDEEENKKKRAAASAPVLSKTTGRVTVILPNKN
ncbi:MAG: Filamentous hemagglutinin family outer membrane protein [Verrucomicrobiales bacterium]|nr:Filamentous hemagglutinin family outer membrane protein [Verrucomicrobiales bacterium]